jgi:hypothetical protein
MAAIYVHAQYASDNGTTYLRRTRADLATALGLTTAAVGTAPPLPRSIKPRYILGIDPNSGHEHKLAGVAVSSGLWTGATNSVTVPDPQLRATGTINLAIAGRVAEKRYAR